MNRSIREQCQADPEAVLQEVERAARRERAEVMHELFVVPLARLFKRAPAKPALQLQTPTA
jgi:hypothetical protein